MRIIYIYMIMIHDGCSVHFDLGQGIQVIRVIPCAKSIWHLPFTLPTQNMVKHAREVELRAQPLLRARAETSV